MNTDIKYAQLINVELLEKLRSIKEQNRQLEEEKKTSFGSSMWKPSFVFEHIFFQSGIICTKKIDPKDRLYEELSKASALNNLFRNFELFLDNITTNSHQYISEVCCTEQH